MADIDVEIEKEEQRRVEREYRGKAFPIAMALILIFFIALFVRSYYGFDAATREGAPYLLSGGSDSYYHMRTIDYFQQNHKHLIPDAMLNYPGGVTNPRPPIWDDSIAIMGMLFTPVFHGDMVVSTYMVMIFITAFFGALTIFPVYYLGREIFNWKAGVIAALFMAIMPGHMERSVLTNADWDSFIIFLIAVSYFFLVKGIKSMKERNWVADWRRPKSIVGGVGEYARANRESLLYAGLSGITMGAVALTWQGFPSPMVIVMIFFVITVFVNRFRKVDNTAITGVFVVSMGTALLISFPYYYATYHVGTWWDVPFYMVLAVSAFGLILLVTRDYPWTLVIPALVILIIGGLLSLVFVSPSTWNMIATAQGYLVKTKAVGTIAEAQATDFSRLAMSLGSAVFLLFFFGLVFIVNHYRKNFKPVMLFAFIWGGMGLYMAISQARFVINATPVAAIIGGWMTLLAIELANFKEIGKTYESLRGNKMQAIRRSIKLKHVTVVLFVTFLVVFPNVWYAVDAGVPFSEKKKVDQQVYDTFPSFMRPNQTTYDSRSPWYFGAWGYDLPGKSNYWTGAYKWLANQDTEIPVPEKRPAFISWWDYGFECVMQGKHPTVADNFQFGYQAAGTFIMAQNESDAVTVYSTRLLEGDLWGNMNAGKGARFSPAVNDALAGNGYDPVKVLDIIQNSSSYIHYVLDHPEIYGPLSGDLNYANAKYAMMKGLVSYNGPDRAVQLYHDLRETTGFSIRYYAVDTRMVPFSGLNTGIFYAPAKLADKRMGGKDSTIPYDFYQIKAKGVLGGEYELDEIPPDVKLDPNNPYVINYQPMFYNSTFYRNFFGYSPAEAGLGSNDGLPGISGSAQSQKPMPGWNMSHFRVVYQTAVWNPAASDDLQNHTGDWVAMNYDDAVRLQNAGQGTAITDFTRVISSFGGVTFLKYYDGATVSGRITVPSGEPVSGATVTVWDEYGIPHGYTATDASGRYSILVPFGNVTLIVSSGEVNKLTKVGANELSRETFPVRDEQAMRARVDRDNDGNWDYLITKDIALKGAAISGRLYIDADRDGKYSSGDIAAAGAEVTAKNTAASFIPVKRVYAGKDGVFEFNVLPPGTYQVDGTLLGHKVSGLSVTVKSGESKGGDIGVKPATVRGNVTLPGGSPAAGANIYVTDLSNGTTMSATSNSTGGFVVSTLLPGNHTFYATLGGLRSPQAQFAAAQNGTINQTASLSPSASVRGRLWSDDFGPAAGATVMLYCGNPSAWAAQATADQSGYYYAAVAAGTYSLQSVYWSGNSPYAAYGALTFAEGETEWANFTMLPALRLNGTVTYLAKSNPISLRMAFESLDAHWEAALNNVNKTGEYQAYLPHGNYAVKISQFVSEDAGGFAYTGRFLLNRSMTMNIALAKGIVVNGTVSEKVSAAGEPDSYETVEGTKVSYTGPDDLSVTAYSGEDGRYLIVLKAGVQYRVQAEKSGYVTAIKPLATAEQYAASPNIAVVPRNITVSGRVLLNGATLGDMITVALEPESPGADAVTKPAAGGKYSIAAPPGNYTLKVDTETTPEQAKYQYSEKIVLAPGQADILRDIAVAKRLRLNGTLSLPQGSGAGEGKNLSVVISLRGPEATEQNVVFQNDTLEQDYAVWAVAGTYNVTATMGDYIAAAKVNLTASTFADLTLGQGVRLDGMVKDGVNVLSNVTVAAENANTGWIGVASSDERGEYAMQVPRDSPYIISVHQHAAKAGDSGIAYVVYDYSGTVTVSGQPVEWNIPVSSAPDNSSIAGAISTSKQKPVPGATVWIYPQGGKPGAISAVTDASGNYGTQISPGEYTFYIHSQVAGRDYAGMSLVSVQPQKGQTVNMTLERGYLISGKLMLDAVSPSPYTEMTVSRGGGGSIRLSTDFDGSYSAWLPAGDYTFASSSSKKEYGMNVSYSLSKKISVSATATEHLYMAKDIVYGVSASWNSAEKQTIAQNATVLYTLTVANTGNHPDTYRLAGNPSTGWKWEFLGLADAKLTLAPKESASVVVRITSPADAKVSHELLSMGASSTNSSTTNSADIDIGIRQVFGVKSSVDTSLKPEYGGKSVEYQVKVENTGNGDDSYRVTIPNIDELASYGWKVILSLEDEEIPVRNALALEAVNVTAGSSKTFKVSANASGASPPDMNVELKVQSKKGPASQILTLEAKSPTLAIGDGDLSALGPRVMAQKGWDWMLTGLYLSAIFIGAGAVIMLRSKRKRWKKK